MRPIKLTMSAFGPFAGVQVIDFRDLGDKNFFLIHGPTGAGKTTILDAICFALYGVTSGAERKGKQMRSDHASSKLQTEVTLDFKLRGKIYRVTRRPEQERPAKRGNGLVQSQQEAEFLVHSDAPYEDGAWSIIESRWRDVTEKIEKLFGFSEDQFRQVVVLPQGQFRRLLVSDSREREKILETLFQTEIYRRIEEALKDAERETSDKLRDTNGRMQAILEQAAVASKEELDELRKKKGPLRKKILSYIEKARKAEKSANNKYSEGKKDFEKFEELEIAKSELKILDAKKGETEAKKITLNAVRKAETLLPEETTLNQRIEEATEAQQKLLNAQRSLKDARTVKKLAKIKLDSEKKREPDRKSVNKELLQLDALTIKVRVLDESKEQLILAEKDCSYRIKEHEKAKSALENCRRKLEDKKETKTEAEKTAAQVKALKVQLKEAKQILEERTKLEDAKKRFNTANKEYKSINSQVRNKDKELLKATKGFSSLEADWIDGQAAILASKLETGTPCPVCGSSEHPMPAHAKVDLPDETLLKNAREEVKEIREALKELGKKESSVYRKVSKYEAESESIKKNLGCNLSVALSVLDTKANELQGSLQNAEKANEGLKRLDDEINKLKVNEKIFLKELSEAEKGLHDATKVKDRTEATVLEQEKGVPESLRNTEDLNKAKSAAIEKDTRFRKAFEKAQETMNRAGEDFVRFEAECTQVQKAYKLATKHVNSCQNNFAKKLKSSGFNNQDDFIMAKEHISNIGALEEEIKFNEGNLKAAESRYYRALKGTKNLRLPDLVALEAVVKKMRGELERQIKEEVSLADELKQIDNCLDKLEKVNSEINKLDKCYAVVGKISDVANGKNPKGIAFQRFVLAALLDDVLEIASKRLNIMSNGRFYLQRSIERGDRRSAGGLDLEVYDSYTGTNRPVSSLSGGESFLASLSLALGLADVVQTYSGGIHLETIFVDEGFGSLDAEALDLAVRTLIDLQGDGRLIGIISHVTELKERIDTRLEVITEKDGSAARFV